MRIDRKLLPNIKEKNLWTDSFLLLPLDNLHYALILLIYCRIQRTSTVLPYINAGPCQIQCDYSFAYLAEYIRLNVSPLLFEICRQFDARYNAFVSRPRPLPRAHSSEYSAEGSQGHRWRIKHVGLTLWWHCACVAKPSEISVVERRRKNIPKHAFYEAARVFEEYISGERSPNET